MITALIVTLIFAAPLLAAAYTDYSEMKIPNEVVLCLLAGFFVTLPLTWMGFGAFTQHMAVGGIAFVIAFGMFALGWLGGGDAKLMAATALWMAPGDVSEWILITTLFGAGLAIFLLLTRKMMPAFVQTNPIVSRLFQGGKDMPYGLALAAGALYVWPTTQIGSALLV